MASEMVEDNFKKIASLAEAYYFALAQAQKQYKQKEILEMAEELEKYYSMDYSDNGFLSTTLLERLNNVVPINGRAQNSGEAIRSFENVAHMYDDLVFGESRSLLEGRHKPSRNPFDLIDNGGSLTDKEMNNALNALFRSYYANVADVYRHADKDLQLGQDG